MHTAVSHRVPLAKGILFAVAFAVLLVAPFFILEVVNSPSAQVELPSVLFAFMFAHAALISVAISPAVLHAVNTRSLRSLSKLHWCGAAIGLALLGIYAGVIMDQMPCFMGVPNCD
jgi:hypothetical protein